MQNCFDKQLGIESLEINATIYIGNDIFFLKLILWHGNAHGTIYLTQMTKNILKLIQN